MREVTWNGVLLERLLNLLLYIPASNGHNTRKRKYGLRYWLEWVRFCLPGEDFQFDDPGSRSVRQGEVKTP